MPQMFSLSWARMRVVLLTLAIACTTMAGLTATQRPAAAEGPNAVVNSAVCTANSLPATDSGSTPPVSIGFNINFYGTTYSSLYVNNNGSVTFDSPLPFLFTPGLDAAAGPIIAPFFADVDTRALGSDIVRYGYGLALYGGRPAFCVNWVNVGYYSSIPGAANKLNSFQLILVDRSDRTPGDFDIVFNYDKVKWETGDTMGGTGGLGGSSATAGFSQGTGTPGTSLLLPGSGVSGAFLDSNLATGLISNSHGPSQLGRYVFEVQNGNPPTGGVHGIITGDGPGKPLFEAIVQVCTVGGGDCQTALTDVAGKYHFVGLAGGTYVLTADPAFNRGLVPGWANVVGLTFTEDREVDVNLGTGTPPPAGTSIVGPNGVPNFGPGNVPVGYWTDPLTLTTIGCPGGTATWQVLQNGSVLPNYTGGMNENPAGTFVGMIPAPYPNHGFMTIHIDITCLDLSTQQVDFNIYIDPSGVVKDTTGATVSGATVTLFRADSAGGPFTQVPDGDSIMSPANRANPDTTDAVGHFGWDVIAGFYKVQATKAGCHAPGNAGQAFAETAVLQIPPPVTNLELVLECAPVLPTVSVSATTMAEGSGGGTTSFPFTISLSSPSATQVTVQYYTADISAAAPSDYTRILPTVVTFPPNTVGQVVNVGVRADADPESDERFSVKLTHPKGATLGTATGVATIVNDDAPLPAVSISDVSQAEGSGGGSTPFTFTVSLCAPSSQTVTVPWYTVGVGATPGSDFVNVAPNNLSFAPGTTSQQVTVSVVADNTREANERFFVRLNPPTHATRAKAVGVGTILNDD